VTTLTGVHLVGSVPMPDAETVFRTVARELGPWLARIPDGETGNRHRWIWWQREMLLHHPAMELDPVTPPFELRQWDGVVVRTTEWLRFRADVDPATVTFHTGYAEAAIESYAVFRRLRDAGELPSGLRFQVCLPTPMSSGYMYISPSSLAAYLPVYERSLLAALRQIVDTVPHQDLSIQWDVCQEVLIFEQYFPHRPASYKTDIFAELARLGDAVPADVECGYHLCYGSPRDAHLVMPKDTAILVEIANGVIDRLGRRWDFLHLPVPQDRSDAAYFAPLRDLRLPAGTTLYLGLIHHDDASGDQARIAAASAVIPSFGVATECGWGRGDPERIPDLLAAHRHAVEH
jgi:methionine synthase II (cobalamin-independent)